MEGLQGRALAEDAGSGASHGRSAGRAATPADARSPTVLIVDDTRANLRLLVDHLESIGLTVLVAQDGEEGRERAEWALPDLILLDVMMPGMDGFETCRRLKASERTREIPVIFMTALADTKAKLAGFAAGGVDYVTKPIHIEEVSARIDTHLTLLGRTRELRAMNQRLEQEIAQRMHAQAVLARRSAELARSNVELEQLAYVASHDLQEPLRMVASYLQLLERRYRDRLDGDAREFIGFAVDGAKRMQALINDLLAYSRVGSATRPHQATDCEAVLRTVLLNLRVALDESGAEVSHTALPVVTGDASQLTQVFQNLIANAIRFRRDEPPRIAIAAQPDGAMWRFSVHDNGIGIAPDYFERIFVLFQRLHGRGDFPGTGIGLALCKKIVERHGGSIRVESEPGRGSIFHFTLPQRRTEEVA